VVVIVGVAVAGIQGSGRPADEDGVGYKLL
jgi:hypothetical protein